MADTDRDFKEYKDLDELTGTVAKLEAAASSTIEPDPQFKISARKRILNSLPETSPEQIGHKRARVFYKRTTLRLTAVFTAFAVALSGVAFASTDSLPGDTLYPIKRAVEEGRVILSRNEEVRAAVYADLADRRLAETEALVKVKRTAKIDATLQLMGAEYDFAQAAVNKLPADKRERMLARLHATATRQQTTLDSFSKNKNISRAVVIRNLERVKKNRARVQELREQRRIERQQQLLERRQQRELQRQERLNQQKAKNRQTP
jgi:hypothetical protein